MFINNINKYSPACQLVQLGGPPGDLRSRTNSEAYKRGRIKTQTNITILVLEGYNGPFDTTRFDTTRFVFPQLMGSALSSLSLSLSLLLLAVAV